MDERDESTFTYEHFLHAGVTPFRVVLNASGYRIGAQGYDPKKGGFFIDNGLLTLLRRDAHVEELTEAEFTFLCECIARSASGGADRTRH